jgi:FkbM family methyltransferase
MLAKQAAAGIMAEVMLTTKTKVALASLAYRCVSVARRVAGKGSSASVRRGGVRWQLDLNEGIDFSIYLLGGFERSTGATLRKLVKAADVVFDIGANIGAHTLGLAQSVGPSGRVFAFEPTDFAFEKLKRNLSLNPDLEARVQARQILLAATSDAQVQARIYASWPLEKDDSVHPKHRGRLETTENASVDTIDHIVQREGIDRLNLIKIDVDGHELPVLQGGLETLKRFGPTLVMEMSPYVHAEEQNSFDALVALLREAGYSLRNSASWKPLPLSASELEALIPDGASINVIARIERGG